MRKIIFIAITLCFTGSVFGQLQPVLKNRRGINILPQVGDYAVGIGANPFLNYLGNMFNGSNNNTSPGTSFASANQSLFLKYMKTNNTAYRINFRLGFVSNTYNTNVADKSPGAAAGGLVKDVTKTNNNNIGLGFGIEKRRGNTRLQGFYGGEIYLNYSSGFDSKMKYGNSLKDDTAVNKRNTEINASSTFTIGLRAFVGVEYFVAPKISIGGEFGYGPSFIVRGANESTSEAYDKVTGETTTSTISTSARSNGFSLDTDNYNGIIKLLFYF